MKYEQNNDFTICSLCSKQFIENEECCFIIVNKIKFVQAQMLDISVKVAHKECSSKNGYKLVNASEHLYAKQCK
jgi:hypothetical protein